MAGSFNEKLGFLILDDVINSFAVEHRGRSVGDRVRLGVMTPRRLDLTNERQLEQTDATMALD